jgi:hypothetical protein
MESCEELNILILGDQSTAAALNQNGWRCYHTKNQSSADLYCE